MAILTLGGRIPFRPSNSTFKSLPQEKTLLSDYSIAHNRGGEEPKYLPTGDLITMTCPLQISIV